VSIKRHEFGYRGMAPSDDGGWVLYADHQAEVERLQRQREGFDCRYAGEYAETSGKHCPIGDPCQRCRLDRAEAEVERLTAEAERERAIRREAIRDNREKTEAVRELQAALAGVLRSYEAYEMLCDPASDGYAAVMRSAWERAASLVPGFDVKALTPWVEGAALAAGEASNNLTPNTLGTLRRLRDVQAALAAGEEKERG
jgi:hypothetical protein